MERTGAAGDRSEPRESGGGIDAVVLNTMGEGRRTGLLDRLSGLLREECGTGQTVLWLPVAMALGAVLWFSSTVKFALLPIAVLFTVLVLWLFARDEGRWRGFLILAAACLAGMLASEFETFRHQTILLDSELTTRIEGRVVDKELDHADRWRYTVDIARTYDPEIRRPPERVRLVARGDHPPVEIGGLISGLARLQPPSGPALPGGFDFAFHSYFNGLGAYGFFYGTPDIMAEADATAMTLPSRFRLGLSRQRAAVAARVRSVLPGDTGGFASALTVADRRGLSPDTVEALRASGLAHVLAISGLHMALVAGTFFLMLRTAFSFFPAVAQALPVKKIAAVGALLVATLYLFISGASVSTQRAWIMLAIILVAVLVDRPALTMRNVAIAAIVIIAISPSAVLGPGFQMSFAATAALIAIYSLWRKSSDMKYVTPGYSGQGGLRVVTVFFVGLAVTSIVAGLATAPYSIFHFHRVATLGLLANLAAMPVVTFVVMPMGLVSMLAMPIGLEHWPLVAMGAGLDAVIWIAHSVADLGGHVVIGRINTGMLLVLTAGFLLFALGKTRLRIAGLAVALCAGVFLVIPSRDDPISVVSEDGRLVALVSDNTLATNRKRPGAFIFEQWQHALNRTRTVGPVVDAAEGSDKDSPTTLLPVFIRRSETMPGFLCAKKLFCVGVAGQGAIVAVLEDLRFLGPACDYADLVVTAKRIALERCYSGAILVTGRMLRQSGSLEVRQGENELEIVSAIGLADRQWTRQRFFDWRSMTYTQSIPPWLAQ